MKATPEDLDAICGSLPEVESGVSWGDRPSYKVPRGGKGKAFVIYRAVRKDAIDPLTGEPYDDLLVISVPDAATKAALVQDAGKPFFTIDHFNGYNAVLVQESRLGELERDELAEVLVDAWACKAPKRLARDYFAGLGGSSVDES